MIIEKLGYNKQKCFEIIERGAVSVSFSHPLLVPRKVTFSCFRMPFPSVLVLLLARARTCDSSWWIVLEQTNLESYVSSPWLALASGDKHGSRRALAPFKLGPLWGVINPPESPAGPRLPSIGKAFLSFSAYLSLTSSFPGYIPLINHFTWISVSVTSREPSLRQYQI